MGAMVRLMPTALRTCRRMGSKVAYLEHHRDWSWESYYWEIATAALDGSRERTLTNLDGDVGSPSWSPDGRRIAFVSRGMISTMSEDGSDLESIPGLGGQLHSGEVYETALPLVWSPDGRRIAFLVDVRLDRSLDPLVMHTVGVDGSDLKKGWSSKLPSLVLRWRSDGICHACLGRGKGPKAVHGRPQWFSPARGSHAT